MQCLSFHAAYGCRHAGECCRAGWDVEVEPTIVDAVRTGLILPIVSTPAPFEPLVEGGGVAPARTRTGDCAFHNNNRCSLQECGSEAMLPSACRHFPRVFLRDARGLLVTLSHFCPTAASLLFEPGPDTIVDAPASLLIAEPIEGLDARDVLPPLVRPGLLADIESYGIWERAVVRTLLEAPDASAALDTIGRATERVRRWTPCDGSLADAVVKAFEDPGDRLAPAPGLRPLDVVLKLTGPHPVMNLPPSFAADWERVHADASAILRRPLARYLAASAFGNWTAYRAQGLRSVVVWLLACYEVVKLQIVRHLADRSGPRDPSDFADPFRMADYVMVHTVDSLAFGRAVAPVER